jgi:biotin synthase-like enzyme
MKYGTGSGVLYRMADGKANAAAGTTGYRWLETAMVEGTELEKDVDISYWTAMVDTAKESINQYIPYDEFVVKKVPPIKDGECRKDCAHCPYLEKWDADKFVSCVISHDNIDDYAKEIGYEVLPF